MKGLEQIVSQVKADWERGETEPLFALLDIMARRIEGTDSALTSVTLSVNQHSLMLHKDTMDALTAEVNKSAADKPDT